MGEVLLASEKADERAPLMRDVIADCAAQYRILSLKSIQDCALCDRPVNVEQDLSVHLRERAQVRRDDDADHASVCTSTESTGGKSRTIGFHESPASVDAY